MDLLVVRGSKYIGIQVKESRYYAGRKRTACHSAHTKTSLSWGDYYPKSSVYEQTESIEKINKIRWDS